MIKLRSWPEKNHPRDLSGKILWNVLSRPNWKNSFYKDLPCWKGYPCDRNVSLNFWIFLFFFLFFLTVYQLIWVALQFLINLFFQVHVEIKYRNILHLPSQCLCYLPLFLLQHNECIRFLSPASWNFKNNDITMNSIIIGDLNGYIWPLICHVNNCRTVELRNQK